MGMPSDQVFVTMNSDEAIAVLERIVQDGDIILVKGSRGVFMDRIVSALGEG